MSIGRIFQIQPFSVNDGEGIRTTIFLAGCPLRCAWCSNPEGLDKKPKVAYNSRTCIGCGKCVQVCPIKIGIDLNEPSNRRRCIACGLCANVCPNGSREVMVKTMTCKEVLEAVKPHFQFFRSSGGGVTFSGGEATAQSEFLLELAGELYDRGIDLAIETSGYFEFEPARELLSLFQMIFVDIKHMDAEKHRLYTGVGNELILRTVSRFRELDAKVVVRIPVIAGVNESEGNIKATAEFVRENLPLASMELLPYHRYGDMKYESLGMKKPPEIFGVPSDETMERLKFCIETCGVKTVRY